MRLVSRTIVLGVLSCVVAASACSQSNPVADSGAPSPGDSGPPPAAGGTGAFGIVTIGGKQKMYLPQSATFDFDSGTEVGLVAVVDVSAAAAPAPSDGGSAATPALITNIELPTPGSEAGSFDAQYATATGGDASVVVAVSSFFPTVWFIDPNTDRVTGTLSLGDTFGTSSFSGGGGYVTGVAVDSAHDRAVLSVWNGYVLLDLATRTVASTILAPAAENFGYDSVTQRIYSPFYSCNDAQGPAGESAPSCGDPKGPDGITVMTDGLQVIDLADPDHTVYTYENPDPDPTGLSATPNEPVGSEPDSAAVDPTTGVVVVPSEGDTFQSIIDMSNAVFDKASKTVTAPRRIIDTSAVSGLDAVAIEPNSHIALFEAEFDTQVAAADLTLANQGNASWAYSDMPTLPDGTDFNNVGDPHGLAVTTALIGGAPVGFVVDGSLRWVGRIEFAQIAKQATGDAGLSLDPLGLGAPDAGVGLNGIGSYVTYLDVTTPE
ncbi:MAG TPA: hypothetical protein VGM06_20025 [Polyangiaceae bacterium]|jgi:hypothetical protein